MAPSAHDANPDAADTFLQNDERVAVGGCTRDPVVGELDGGANRRMARELKLGEGREDPDIGGVSWEARRQHKHGFGKIELARDRLHFAGR